jgi:hypothetical protein
MKKGLNLVLGFGLLIIAALACNFSATTANISSVKLGKDKNISQEANDFGPRDTIYGVAQIANVPDKVQVKGRLVVDDVEGQEVGPIPGLEDTVELGGSGTATFTFTPPTAGWPKGRYKMEIFLLTEGGEQKDQETAGFVVTSD